jgi:hypothetical protein
MKHGHAWLLAGLTMALAPAAFAQSGNITVPHSIEAGSAFSVQTAGSGKGVLYIVGPGQAVRRELDLGGRTSFAAGDIYSAGHYLAILTVGTSNEIAEFDVTPAAKPETLSFLARPSRVPVGLHGGISGAVYVFDSYNNLITTPMPVVFDLAGLSGTSQSRTVTTRNGMAWTQMDSAEKQGAAKFIARAQDVSSERVIAEVPGDPCGLTISAHPEAGKLNVQTAPIHDCSGNPVPDGTIVTFIETYNGSQSTVDVPIKKGIASVNLPAYSGAKISVASGVVAGNEIRWGGGL